MKFITLLLSSLFFFSCGVHEDASDLNTFHKGFRYSCNGKLAKWELNPSTKNRVKIIEEAKFDFESRKYDERKDAVSKQAHDDAASQFKSSCEKSARRKNFNVALCINPRLVDASTGPREYLTFDATFFLTVECSLIEK